VVSTTKEPCAFPACAGTAAGSGFTRLALCAEHRLLLLDDPGEFRRLWGALDPRPQPRPASRAPGAPRAPLPPAS
jgi:hypothetical protein